MIRKLIITDLEILKTDDDYTTACAMVGNVGYELIMPNRSFKKAKDNLDNQSRFEMHTSHQLSEREESLYGFADLREYELFNMLLEVSGVGNKTAMSMVQWLTLAKVKKAVKDKDLDVFKQISGIGSSTAEKVYISMKKQLGL